VAKASLARPLANVAKTGRNFLKAEAFRLLSLMYGIPSPVPTISTNDEGVDSDNLKPVGLEQLEESSGDVMEAILASLEDKDAKAKHRKDVFKTLEKLVAWVTKELNPCSADLAYKLEQLAGKLNEMGGTMDTPALKQQCDRIVQDVRVICSKAKSAKAANDTEKGSGKKKKSHSPKQNEEGSGKKKKTKKEKKK
jgi:hypothetical protein